MVRAWYIDDNTSNARNENHKNPPKYVDMEVLKTLTGVEYFKLDIDTIATDGKLEALKKERGYNYEDELVCSKECLPNFEEKLKTFYTEHLHPNEEIRLIAEGSGYFDVRDKNDEWIRIAVLPGDLLILPSGIYHRFTLDYKNYIKTRRFFMDSPIWTCHNRTYDSLDCRKQYTPKNVKVQ